MKDPNLAVWLSTLINTAKEDEHFWPKLLVKSMITDDLENFSIALKKIKDMPNGFSTIFGNNYFSYTILHLFATYSSKSFLNLVNVQDFSKEIWKVKLSGSQAKKLQFNLSPIEISILNGVTDFTSWTSSTVSLQISGDVMINIAYRLVSSSRFDEFFLMTKALNDDEFMSYYHAPNNKLLLSFSSDSRLIKLFLKRGFSWEDQNNKKEIVADIWLKNIGKFIFSQHFVYPPSKKSLLDLVSALLSDVAILGFPFNHDSGFVWEALYNMGEFSLPLFSQMDIKWKSKEGDNGLLYMIEKNCVFSPPRLHAWGFMLSLIKSGSFNLTEKGSGGRSVEDWLRLWMDWSSTEENNGKDSLIREEMTIICVQCCELILSKTSLSKVRIVTKV